MANTFTFELEHRDIMHEHRADLLKLYNEQKAKYFATEGRQRDLLKDCGATIRQIRAEAKSDWEDLTLVKSRKALESRGLIPKDLTIRQLISRNQIQRLRNIGLQGLLQYPLVRKLDKHLNGLFPGALDICYNTLLPKTFQDAVEVTRAIEIRYLWIDSLCIIQEGDGGKDWDQESIKMEDVFSQAYCTIAATSAANSCSGFLDRTLRTESILIQPEIGARFYISTDIDDYDRDVEGATLNRRAWVLQEAILSRRILHFTANQIYFGCGEGVYCENLVRLIDASESVYFATDPEFPTRLHIVDSYQRRVAALYDLITEYQCRIITFQRDRANAFAGLENRIADVLFTKSRFGVFERHLHRMVTWMVDPEVPHHFDIDDSIPSWSWLSNPGAVDWFTNPFLRMFNNPKVRFHETRDEALVMDLANFQECTFEIGTQVDNDGVPGDIHDVVWVYQEGLYRGSLLLDTNQAMQKEFRTFRCVVIGKLEIDHVVRTPPQEYIVLVVLPTAVDGEYRRIGMGRVHQNLVVKERDEVLLV
ncbi:hypothetical protein E8E12_001177 [Didymella heteroderae]|uniref:Heterokaryon incompatibility domain-containing protein n=1 Tax=Didymella heteroderae TaxID=1769908 RepID=A0A9P4WFW7_9PLEO|nr:hypothetical protein E8E12_001177 [Didymella heteroderae]